MRGLAGGFSFVVAADPDNDAVLECALAGKAAIVVSGAVHLPKLGQWKHIRILSPSEALKEIEGQNAWTPTNQRLGRVYF